MPYTQQLPNQIAPATSQSLEMMPDEARKHQNLPNQPHNETVNIMRKVGLRNSLR